MEVSIDWDITLFKGHIESEGIAEHFADAPNVGAFNTTMSFPSINATDREPPVITPFQDLRVGWKMTNNFLDHVTGIFNPRLLREEVQSLDAALHVLTLLKPGQFPKAEQGRLTISSKEKKVNTETAHLLEQLIAQASKKFLLYANSNLYAPAEVIEEGNKLASTLTEVFTVLKSLENKVQRDEKQSKAIARLTGLIDGKTLPAIEMALLPHQAKVAG